jgi:hypothetical protein
LNCFKNAKTWALGTFLIFAPLTSSTYGMDNIPAYYARWTHGVPSDPNFFPIFVWLQSPSNAAAYKKAGIDFFIGLWKGPTEEQLSGLASVGMPVLCEQNLVGLHHLKDEGIMGWTQPDEPDNAQEFPTGGYGPCVDPQVVIKNYNTWRKKAPSRPVYLNLGQGSSYITYPGRGSSCAGQTQIYPQYIQGADIISFDIYPVNNPAKEVRDNLWYVPQGIDNLRAWSNDTKPVWCWIECTLIGRDSPGKPTPAQVRSEVWMALIHGAAGIGYFCHSFHPSFNEAALLHDPVMLKAVTALNLQIHSLATVLNSNTFKNFTTVHSSDNSVPIDLMVKQVGGSTYLFTVAMRDGKTTGVFTIPLPDTHIEVLGENRKTELKGGKFSDHFQPYGVHLYKINSTTLAGSGATPSIQKVLP